MAIDLTPAKLADIKKKAEAAENCSPSPWVFKEMPAVKGEVRDSENFQVAGWFCLRWQADYIAAADPATVLAMLEEIEVLKTALNLLLWEYYSTDLEQEDIDKLFKKQIEMAKKYRKSEAGQ